MKRICTILIFLLFTSCRQASDTPKVAGRSPYREKLQQHLKPFKLTVYSFNYSLAYALQYVLTEKEPQVLFNGELEGEKDMTLFRTALPPTSALQKISSIDFSSLQEYYVNPCIKDGSQLTVRLDIGTVSKTTQLSNFYQPDVGEAIELINRITPEKFRIWYDKKTLLEDQENCK
jgi:hypothetical protein